ncbi:hypothetical protein BX070DRAFT_228161 [Coemansia spiralis]|nr:hypothetical protein BX070DRAFT_228161 [Coemansia spiralis]
MFAIVFLAVVLELLASMGTFGALAAQNLYTNSAAGWYIRLDWTAVYAYAVTMLSIIVTLILVIGGLARGASKSGRACGFIFNSAALFIFGFVFSVLWVVIAGFAYRNPLPMKYPCDIFRHLRGSLEMLGLASGKSLIEEGGLLVGICQSSKAFLVLTGLGLGLWILIFVLSCATMITGLNPPGKSASVASSRRSLRSYISSVHQKRHGANQPPLSANYLKSGPAKPLARPPPTATYNRASPPTAIRRGYNTSYDASALNTGEKAMQMAAYAPNALQNNTAPCPYQCQHGYAPQQANVASRQAAGKPHSSTPSPLLSVPAEPARRAAPGSSARQVNVLADPRNAFSPNGYSRSASPRAIPSSNRNRSGTHHAYQSHQEVIDEAGVIGNEAALDEENSVLDIDVTENRNNEMSHHHRHYSQDEGNEYADAYEPHHQDHHYQHQHAQGDSRHSPPSSQTSRRQRLRQIFGRDAEVPIGHPN